MLNLFEESFTYFFILIIFVFYLNFKNFRIKLIFYFNFHMRFNLTLIEVGRLCPALFSLLRVSPQINVDYKSRTLLKLINGSDCKWSNKNGNELMNALIERAIINENTINVKSPRDLNKNNVSIGKNYLSFRKNQNVILF